MLMIKKKNKTNTSVIFMFLVMCFIAVVIVVKILYIQTLHPQVSQISVPKFKKIKAPRGNIFSDNGSLLAISMPLYNVHLDLSVIDDKIFEQEYRDLAAGLSELFKDKNQSEYQLFLTNNKSKNSKYVRLKNKVTHNQLNILKKLPILALGKNKGGLIAEQRPNRENPFGILAKRTIGLLRNSNPIGLERAYNKTLSGSDGLQLKQKIGKNLWRDEPSELNLNPQAGSDVISTIDIDMQDVAQKALSSALIHHDADWGTVIMMEVKSGHVKLIANLKKNEDGSLDENYNHAIAKHSEPGSTFKLASILSGIEDGFYSLEDSVDTENGTYKFYDQTMRDSKKGGYGKITIGEAFVKSSNVGISKITNKFYKHNPELFIDRIYKMGLCTPLDLELPYPNSLLVKRPGTKQWSGVTLPWMSIGYSLRLTPIHMLAFYNAVANKGVMVKPLFTSAISRDGEIVVQNETKIINPAICAKSSIEKITPYLIDVIDNGTAKSISNPNYKIAGKTGTTLLGYGNNSEGSQKKYQASFVGFFPGENPKYSCIVVVSNPKKNGFYGGNVAAPIFKEISDKVFASDISLHHVITSSQLVNSLPRVCNGNTNDISNALEILNVPYNSTQSKWSVVVGGDQLSLRVRKIRDDLKNNKIPNLSGMVMNDIVFLLENFGLDVNISGKGKVIYQSLKKGEVFNHGSLINIIASL